jgi:hypothetical protein
MPSPFPGMNPYLEQERYWNSFHQQFCIHCMEALVTLLHPNFLVRLEDYVYIHELPEDDRRPVGRPDVSVTRNPVPAESRTAGATLQAPIRGRVLPAVDVERLSRIVVRDRDDQEVIAVVELLSPSNKKTGPDREQYLGKRRELLNSPAHLVEIDLLRGWPRLPIEDLPDCDYYVMVSRAEQRPEVGLWPLRLRDPLPPVPVPLRPPHADVVLDLQLLLHEVYDRGGYGAYVYRGAPQPRLHPEDEAWARPFLPAP